MGQLIGRHDWSKTSLGPIEGWPQPIRTTIGLILGCPTPIVTLWGDQGVMIYNDTYAAFAGPRHPALLGQPVREGWPELSGFNDRVMKMVLAGGVLSYRDQEMTLSRSGVPEQVWMNLDYFPVVDDAGVPIGVMALVVETTGRIAAERELKLEETQREADRTRQRRLFEQAPGFIAITRGPDQVVEFVNDTHRKMFNSGDWLGQPIRAAIPSIEGQGFFEQLDQVYQTGKSLDLQGVEIRYRRTSESEPELHYITLMHAPLYDDDGAVSGVFTEGVNVSEGERAHRRAAALSALTAQLAAIDDPEQLALAATEMVARELEANRAGYGLVEDATQTIVMMSDWRAPGLPGLAGLMRFEQLGPFLEDLQRGETVLIPDIQHDHRIEGPGDWLEPLGIRSVLNVPITEQGRLVAVVFVNDGRVRQWTEDEILLVRQVAERTRGAIERRRAERLLRENEARLRFLDGLSRETARHAGADAILATTTRLLGEHLGVSVCAYADMDEDQDGFTIRGDWAAPGAQSIVGHYSLAAFGRLAVSRLRAGEPLVLADNAAELPPEEAATFLSIGLAATICMPLVKDGRLIALMAVHDRVPRLWSANELALLPEVTERSWAHIERVRAEAERREGEQRFLAELEAKVAERTAALQQAQKMEAIGQLTGGVAHDFNNLLMAVSGSLELLRKRVPQEPKLLQLIDNAGEATRRGSSLTKRMLAFARRQELQSERVDLQSLVAGMTELLSRSLGPMVEIETRFPARLPQVAIDPNQLESALLNLMVNARDAMQGEGRVVISGREETVGYDNRHLAPGDYVCLSVSDSGEGMDEATLKRATEPFFTTKEVGDGTGLGLSMVLGFAEQSGGTLQLRSRPGDGTTAEIWLRALSPEDQTAVETERLRAPTPQVVEARALAILAVDDDVLVLMNTVAMLEDLGHSVTAAYSAREALEAMEQQSFDLVVTDHAMPRMTGTQLAGEIRQKLPALPIVLATGYAELPTGPGAPLPRLSKPFSIAELSAAVNRATASRSGVA